MHVHRQSTKKYPNVTKKVVKLFFFILGVIGILIGFLMAAGGKIIPNWFRELDTFFSEKVGPLIDKFHERKKNKGSVHETGLDIFIHC